MKFIVIFLLMQSAFCDLDTKWWKFSTIYEVFIWSFKDSNGDGVGDIKGITFMLDYLADLKIDIIYLSPFYNSPMEDMGYDVSNYTNIDSRFGTMDDFKELIVEMNKRGLRLIIDIVMNHSSDEHPWFEKSVARVDPYTDFYVWHNAKGYNSQGEPIPPNNWMSLFGGSAWEWNNMRKQFYLHQFSKKQPDFNLRNNALKDEIYEIFKFWLEKGVAGFRMDATMQYFEDPQFRDEPPINPRITKIEKYKDLTHIYTADLWETYEYLHDIRKFVDEYSRKEDDYERILIAEAYTTLNYTMAYYGQKNYPIMHFPFNFKLVTLKKFYNATTFESYLHQWLDNMPKGATSNWVSGNHDPLRIGDRLNEQYLDIIITVIMTLPGVACLYYGDEIGMIGTQMRDDQLKDPGGLVGNRDSQRLPMQWDDSTNAGFSSKPQTWLPVNADYWEVNVEAEKKNKNSRLNLVKNLIEIRKTEKTLKLGSFHSYVLATWVLAFTRTYKGYESYLVILNLGTETEIIDVHLQIPNLTPNLKVIASSINSGYNKGTIINYFPKVPQLFAMRPLSTLVLKTISEKLISPEDE